MLDFIKRNVKFVITLGVSVVLVAGLTTALIVTNTGSASARGRDRNNARVELTEEQIAERAENARARLEQKLADGDITQEQYDEKLAAIESGDFRGSGNRGQRGSRGDRSSRHENLTDEEIAERAAARAERAIAKIDQKLADGDITQEQYDEKLAAIESGEFRGSGRGSRDGKSNESTNDEEAN